MRECEHSVDESELGEADWRTQFESCSQQVVAALEVKMDLEEKPKLDLSARIPTHSCGHSSYSNS